MPGAKGLARKLEAGRDEAFLARRLVQLCDEVPVTEVAADRVGSGRAAVPGAAQGPGGLLAQTRWAGPVADAGELFDELGTQGALRGFLALHGALE